MTGPDGHAAAGADPVPDSARGNAPSQQVLVEVTVRVAAAAREVTTAQLEQELPEGLLVVDHDDGTCSVGTHVPERAAAQARRTLQAAGTRAHELLGIDAPVTTEASRVPGDWRERWRSWHQPVVIGPLWVGPPWQLPAPAGHKAIVIDPGQGFGTGAHPTTRMMLRMLCELPPSRVIDLGTGSGVLAIAARRLGHEVLLACDHDPAAIDSARDNLERNGVRVPIRQLDLLAPRTELPEADVALANLSLDVLLELIPRLDQHTLVLSGLLPAQRAPIRDLLDEHGYSVADERGRDGWACIRATSRSERIREAPPALW